MYEFVIEHKLLVSLLSIACNIMVFHLWTKHHQLACDLKEHDAFIAIAGLPATLISCAMTIGIITRGGITQYWF